SPYLATRRPHHVGQPGDPAQGTEVGHERGARAAANHHRGYRRSGMRVGPAHPSPAPLAFLNGGGEMGERMRAHDWSMTPLGSPQDWPQSLKTIVRMMLDSRYAMWMAWGPELTFFCNDAYLPTLGIKRTWALGARSDEVWKEVW